MVEEIILKTEESKNTASELAVESVGDIIEVAEVLAEEKAEATVALVTLQAEISALRMEIIDIRNALGAHEISNVSDFDNLRTQIGQLELGLAGLTDILEETADDVEELLREEIRDELSETTETVALESGEVPANVAEHLDTTIPGETAPEEHHRKRHFVRI
jgi:hypothetical protein